MHYIEGAVRIVRHYLDCNLSDLTLWMEFWRQHYRMRSTSPHGLYIGYLDARR
jgi:hypothetical protein